MESGYASQATALIPSHRDVVGQKYVKDSALEPDENGAVAGRHTDLAVSIAALEMNTASAEIPDGFRPDTRPESAKLLGRQTRARIRDSMDRHTQRRLRNRRSQPFFEGHERRGCRSCTPG